MYENFSNLFSFNGRLNRTRFLHSLLILIVVVIGINLFLDFLLSSQQLLSVGFLVAKRLLEIFYLAAFSPFIVRRLHDLGLDGKWVIICWLSVLLDQRLLLLIEVLYGIKIVAPVNLMMLFELAAPAFVLWLLFKPGEARINRWGEKKD